VQDDQHSQAAVRVGTAGSILPKFDLRYVSAAQEAECSACTAVFFQNPSTPAVFPRDAEGLEVMVAMCVLAGDAVALDGMIPVHRQRQRRAEAHAFLRPISPRGMLRSV
jgi:hypothetical protein